MKFWKVALGLTVVGAAVAFVVNAASATKEMLEKLTFRVTAYGFPKLSGKLFQLPVTIRLTNKTSQSLTIDSIQLRTYFLDAKKTFVPAGDAFISAFTIVPGDTDKSFVVNIDTKAVTGDLVDNILNFLNENKIVTRTDVQVKLAGLDLPMQSITQQINV